MIADFFSSFAILKIGFLVLILFHSVFLFIVFSQISSMNRVINQAGISSIVKTISVITIVFSLSLFLVALVIL